MTQTQNPPAGWYPDPAGGGGQRWWNGMVWSDHVQPTPDAVAQAWAPVASPTPVKHRGDNHYAFITFGFAALYIVLAIATHIVLIGVVPILMAVRSLRSRESLAPVAMGVAIITAIVSVVTLSGH